MHSSQPRSFDFARYRSTVAQYVELIRRFATHEELRSAHVDELKLDEDFYRRPLRPEDLLFIDFTKPVIAETVTHLPFLAAQRLLLCINELEIARLPRDSAVESFRRCTNFYGDDNRVLATQIRPFLESFTFDFLDVGSRSGKADDLISQLEEFLQIESTFWDSLFGRLAQQRYMEEGFRFILMQKWSLATSKRAALARAAASGYFETLALKDWPRLPHNSESDEILRRLALWCGVSKREHSYWQFYLSTSLAECNLLYALATRPDWALRLCGAAFAMEVAWVAFSSFIEQAGPCVGVGDRSSCGTQDKAPAKELTARFGRALNSIIDRYGSRGLTEVEQGFVTVQQLAASARRNLGEQLLWLTRIDTYRDFAHVINTRIVAEYPNIDRETFVEPREMCSTTHVHDDHRLVVIESGTMVFWGNLGMKLRLQPGEMVLVPQGRLHGSSIESDECIYHQPIIPNEWVHVLIGDLSV